MNREYLLSTVQHLVQPHKESTDEYAEKSESLVNSINSHMLSRMDIQGLVGEQNLEMMKDNHANHARFMESIFTNLDHGVLVDTILWVFKAYKSHQFNSTYWAAQLNGWINILKENLTEKTYNEILPFYKWMQVNIPVFNEITEQNINTPLSAH